MRPVPVGCALALALAIALASSAAELDHPAEAGDTWESLARRYYQDESLAESLARHNLSSAEQRPAVGTALRVPMADLHHVEPGDTWASLAERYWGSATRQRELAELSGRVRAVLEPGEDVVIPALIAHRVRPGESLASVSRRLYGHPERAKALGRLNELERPDALAVGQLVRIPVLQLADGSAPAAAPSMESAPPAAVAEPVSPTAFTLDSRLVEAIEQYRTGEYERALETLVALREGLLATGRPEEKASLLLHLVYAYTAFDREDDACRTLAELRQHAAHFSWDSTRDSPKVIALDERCR